MWSTERAGAAAGLLLTVATLGACATGQPPAAGTPGAVAAAPTPLDQYAPTIERTPSRLALGVHAAGLSPRQHAALVDFVTHWRESGAAEVITLDAPVGGRIEADPALAAADLARALEVLGVPPERLRTAAYDAAGAPGAPLVLRYERIVAHGADCASRWDNLVATGGNGASRHFGCTAAANLAVEIADAHDLVAPAASQPGDGVRRALVLDKYRQGQSPATAKDAQANGAVSAAIQ